MENQIFSTVDRFFLYIYSAILMILALIATAAAALITGITVGFCIFYFIKITACIVKWILPFMPFF
jgi:hypothetical protein